jgi:hypothetical protein
MNQKLQQAIAATRAGQKREAQVLLTQVLQEEPEEVHAWYLLGLLVESPHKQRAYLGKVLALDPDHEKARQHLARLETAAPPIDFEAETLEEETQTHGAEAELAPAPRQLSVESDFMAQERGDTLPDWMADHADHLNLDQIELAETAPSATLDVLDDTDVPDWLQEVTDESWIEAGKPGLAEEAEEPERPELVPAQSELPVAAAETPEVTPAKTQKTPATRPESGRDVQRRQEAQLTRLLIGLIAVALVIFILLVYVATTTF